MIGKRTLKKPRCVKCTVNEYLDKCSKLELPKDSTFYDDDNDADEGAVDGLIQQNKDNVMDKNETSAYAAQTSWKM